MDNDIVYRPRLIDEVIKDKLNYTGAICIEGPKWSGKTSTAIYHGNSIFSVADSSNAYQNRTLALMDPDLVLSGDKPRVIDEWQEVPSLWDAVRSNVDRNVGKGLYILTGSATPNDEGIIHSGVGRITTLSMRTMSLFESGDSSGAISIRSMFDGTFENKITGNVDLKHLIQLTARGGWPGSLGLDDKAAMSIPKDYLKGVVKNDLRKMDGPQRNEEKFWMLLRSLARNESTSASKNTIIKDISDNDGADISYPTIDSYICDLGRLHLIEDCKPFIPNLRSPKRVGKVKKRHFTDPSLVIAALGATPKMLLDDLETYGFIFESMCDRDLDIYAKSLGGELYYYRDNEGYELDSVIVLEDGRWGAFEIKLGFHQVEGAAKNLIKVCDYIKNNSQARDPAFMCVICGTSSAAIKRDDGVYVVPITALRN